MVKLVGILNITPDSFSDGGKFVDPKAALAQAEQLFKDGASLVDVGAESTRPGAVALTDEEEWRRLEPILPVLMRRYPGRVSLDTYHPATAARALKISPVIINDVTGMNNPAMEEAVAKYKPLCIVSHLPGQDIQAAHQGQLVDSLERVKAELLDRAALLQSKGLAKDRIILDPGIGFGKTPELNWQLLRFAEQVPDYKVMIGYSRKRFLGENRMELEPSLEAGKIAIASGVAYLRVHDVAGHRALLESLSFRT
ncbi:MAG TPA: dihydropteroate synthase [Candidatus Saccharimonadales bacterium]|nr:dihydropteroate synthase [Candidatus Saccharimonadales bacterium]